VEDFRCRCTNIEVPVWVWSAWLALHVTETICTLYYIPRNSTQLISISSLSPSADNGRSSSRLRRTNGPISGAGRFLFLDVGSSGSRGPILKQFVLKLSSSHISGQLPTQLDVSGARLWWVREHSRLPFRKTRQGSERI
jgi:hypothetical protein